ncbi:MAG TPA: 30S ribosomal protein S17 [Candidatus Nanoarchaeia archaeon]|nr:30S ribosomal protein S17 [Candidatus Nanoarchaeia archaeon]
MAEKTKNSKKTEEAKLVSTQTKEPTNLRGRTFQGYITKKFPKRIVVEFERTVYVKKYRAFYKKKTRIHARLPDSLADSMLIGDYIEVKECRPLSKLIHFIAVKKIRSKESKQ